MSDSWRKFAATDWRGLLRSATTPLRGSEKMVIFRRRPIQVVGTTFSREPLRKRLRPRLLPAHAVFQQDAL